MVLLPLDSAWAALPTAVEQAQIVMHLEEAATVVHRGVDRLLVVEIEVDRETDETTPIEVSTTIRAIATGTITMYRLPMAGMIVVGTKEIIIMSRSRTCKEVMREARAIRMDVIQGSHRREMSLMVSFCVSLLFRRGERNEREIMFEELGGLPEQPVRGISARSIASISTNGIERHSLWRKRSSDLLKEIKRLDARDLPFWQTGP